MKKLLLIFLLSGCLQPNDDCLKDKHVWGRWGSVEYNLQTRQCINCGIAESRIINPTRSYSIEK